MLYSDTIEFFKSAMLILIFKTREVEQDNFGANGTFELTYELDLEQETFELVQVHIYS